MANLTVSHFVPFSPATFDPTFLAAPGSIVFLAAPGSNYMLGYLLILLSDRLHSFEGYNFWKFSNLATILHDCFKY